MEGRHGIFKEGGLLKNPTSWVAVGATSEGVRGRDLLEWRPSLGRVLQTLHQGLPPPPAPLQCLSLKAVKCVWFTNNNIADIYSCLLKHSSKTNICKRPAQSNKFQHKLLHTLLLPVPTFLNFVYCFLCFFSIALLYLVLLDFEVYEKMLVYSMHFARGFFIRLLSWWGLSVLMHVAMVHPFSQLCGVVL